MLSYHILFHTLSGLIFYWMNKLCLTKHTQISPKILASQLQLQSLTPNSQWLRKSSSFHSGPRDMNSNCLLTNVKGTFNRLHTWSVACENICMSFLSVCLFVKSLKVKSSTPNRSIYSTDSDSRTQFLCLFIKKHYK